MLLNWKRIPPVFASHRSPVEDDSHQHLLLIFFVQVAKPSFPRVEASPARQGIKEEADVMDAREMLESSITIARDTSQLLRPEVYVL